MATYSSIPRQMDISGKVALSGVAPRPSAGSHHQRVCAPSGRPQCLHCMPCSRQASSRRWGPGVSCSAVLGCCSTAVPADCLLPTTCCRHHVAGADVVRWRCHWCHLCSHRGQRRGACDTHTRLPQRLLQLPAPTGRASAPQQPLGMPSRARAHQCPMRLLQRACCGICASIKLHSADMRTTRHEQECTNAGSMLIAGSGACSRQCLVLSRA